MRFKSKPKKLTMSKRSEKALDKSVELWKKKVARGRGDGTDCPLCLMYSNKGNMLKNCKRCPVYLKVNQKGCYGTPFWRNDDFGDYDKYAKAEVNFLISCYY